jgi:hypothetical protein
MLDILLTFFQGVHDLFGRNTPFRRRLVVAGTLLLGAFLLLMAGAAMYFSLLK